MSIIHTPCHTCSITVEIRCINEEKESCIDTFEIEIKDGWYSALKYIAQIRSQLFIKFKILILMIDEFYYTSLVKKPYISHRGDCFSHCKNSYDKIPEYVDSFIIHSGYMSAIYRAKNRILHKEDEQFKQKD